MSVADIFVEEIGELTKRLLSLREKIERFIFECKDAEVLEKVAKRLWSFVLALAHESSQYKLLRELIDMRIRYLEKKEEDRDGDGV